MNLKKSVLGIVLLLFAGMFILSEAMAKNPAPTGTYVGKLGASVVAGSTRRAGMGKRMHKRQFQAPQNEREIKITITSYSTSEELEELKAAQGDMQKFVSILANFNHGSVEIGNQSYPINMATSNSAQGKYGVYVLSTKPFAGTTVCRRFQGTAQSASGASVGVICLFVDAEGHGSGRLCTTTQVAIGTDGEVTARGGVSSKAEITDVVRQ